MNTQAEVEVIQHRLGVSEAELVGRRQQLTQRLQEERQASQSILAYLDRHYNVRGRAGKACLQHHTTPPLSLHIIILLSFSFSLSLPLFSGPWLPAGPLDDQT